MSNIGQPVAPGIVIPESEPIEMPEQIPTAPVEAPVEPVKEPVPA